jgi:tetratricopeptide (TPR) repeat protein
MVKKVQERISLEKQKTETALAEKKVQDGIDADRKNIASLYKNAENLIRTDSLQDAMVVLKRISFVEPNYLDVNRLIDEAETEINNRKAIDYFNKGKAEYQKGEDYGLAWTYFKLAKGLSPNLEGVDSEINRSEYAIKQAVEDKKIADKKNSIKEMGEYYTDRIDFSVTNLTKDGPEIKMYVYVFNGSGDTHSTNPNYFTLVDSEGNACAYDKATFDTSEPFGAVDLPSGTGTGGWLIFGIPSQNEPVRLVYSNGFGVSVDKKLILEQ